MTPPTQAAFYNAFNELTKTIARPEDAFLTQDPMCLLIIQKIKRLSTTQHTVLLCGPSGTGKSLLAQGLASLAGRTFTENCSAFPDKTLGYARLHGYKKGAFTGAVDDRPGIFEAATHPSITNTVFLDEIGDMPLDMQPQLLRILQDKVVNPLGTHVETEVKFRLVAATNKNLEDEVNAGRFRADLYGRLMEITLHIPPLSARVGDIELLCQHYGLPDDAVKLLQLHTTKTDLYGVRYIQALAARYKLFNTLD